MKSTLKNLTYLVLLFNLLLYGQTPELETAQTKLTKIWGGIAANGDKATFDFRAAFFPNDFDFIQHRGQGSENHLGSGFRLACTDWKAPDDSLFRAAVFGPINDYMLSGKVVNPITNYARYKYPEQTVNNNLVTISDFATFDPTKFSGGTYDQIVESTYKNVLGVEVKRKILGWSQNFNDNYIIIDVELTNVGVDHISTSGADSLVQDTLRNFYFSMNQGVTNNFYSNGSNPAPSSSERPNYGYVWQHYYGARAGDSLRVFYFYSADDPNGTGDNMGSPVLSQKGRLLNTNLSFYTILHSSGQAYLDPAQDVDDFLQPKVTYIGTETRIPNPGSGEDPYGSKNYWAIRGGFSDKNLMPNSIPGTHHMLNNDEIGTPNFSNFSGGTISAVNSKNFSSFGPYIFPPNHKLHFVYAVGFAGIGLIKSQEIGEKWLNKTLTDPPNMPNPTTGWLPSNFAFPTDANEFDKSKDRWLSMGIDSVMLAAWRAKWNYDHEYQIPQAPPPVQSFTVSGSGALDGVILNWKNSQAEALTNFAGYSISRRLTNQDTVFYSEIYLSGSEDKAIEHSFLDTSVISGVPYYYYIQTKTKIDENDLNADPTTRGQILCSSRIWIPNIAQINPPKYSTEDMSKIRIVPNPYNINDPLVKQYFSQPGIDLRRLTFYNLPGTVTIRIFTENGDLIKTINHSSPQSDGSTGWDMITDSQQVISSGIYIAVFQKPDGEISYQKFIVVR